MPGPSRSSAGTRGGRPPRPSARAQEQERARQAAQRRRERRILLAAVLAFVVVVVGGGIALQAWRTGRSPSAADTAAAGAPLAPVPVVTGQPLRFGSGTAPVIVALFEDFHCPHCVEFEEQYGPVLTEARDAGTARVELYPMAFVDAGSLPAANAMACAAEAGFGPAYYRGLFANATLRWSDQQLLDLADQVAGRTTGPAGDGFRSCVTGRAHADWVASMDTAAQAQGVTGTPALFVDGTRVDPATLTPDRLRAQLEAAAG